VGNPKGGIAEREIVTYLRSIDLDARKRYRSGAKDTGDVWIVCPFSPPGRSLVLVVEVKNYDLNKGESRPTPGMLEKWQNEAIVEAQNARNHFEFPKDHLEVPVVVYKRRGYGAARAGGWWLRYKASAFRGRQVWVETTVDEFFGVH